MAVGADTFTISAIVLLIVGAVCFYLFTRIKQVEKKLAFMESILLDLKTATEAGFLGFPAGGLPLEETEEADEDDEEAGEEETFLPLKPDEELEAVAEEDAVDAVRKIEIDELIASSGTGVPSFDDAEEADLKTDSGSVQVTKMDSFAPADLDSMSFSELSSLAKSRGMTVTSKMRKAQLLTALRQMEVATPPLPVPPAIQPASVAPAAEQTLLEPDGMAAGSSLLSSSSLMSSPL
jgi:hypothetical protein